MATWRLITEDPTDDRGPLPPHAHVPSRWALRLLEVLLLLVGLACLGTYAYVSIETALYQAYETRELDAILASAPHATATPPRATATPPRARARPSTPPSTKTPPVSPRPRRRPANGTMIGRLEIPRLNVSAIVRAGSDARTLRLAIGHIGGTAFPGEPGNVGLAAHRDTFFRRLGDIHTNDQVRVVTREGTFSYRVQSTQIVEPRDTWVLSQTSARILTLITCYPFSYIGSAPQRFVVRAELDSE